MSIFIKRKQKFKINTRPGIKPEREIC